MFGVWVQWRLRNPLGDYSKALALQGAEKAKNDGNAQYKRGNWAGAVTAYTLAVTVLAELTGGTGPAVGGRATDDVDEMWSTVLGNRAQALLMQAKLAEALTDCTEALAYNESNRPGPSPVRRCLSSEVLFAVATAATEAFTLCVERM